MFASVSHSTKKRDTPLLHARDVQLRRLSTGYSGHDRSAAWHAARPPIQLRARSPSPKDTRAAVFRDPGIPGLPSSVTQGYPGRRLPSPRDIRVAVFRAPGISGSRRFSVPRGVSGRGGFPCPRDIRVAAVFRAPEQIRAAAFRAPGNSAWSSYRDPMSASCSSSVSQLLHH